MKNDWRVIYNSIYYDFWVKNWLKNEWEIVYNNIYYDLQSKFDWKMSKKNDWRVIYNSIYYHSQSKMSKKNDWREYIIVYTIILSQFLNQKWVRKMTEE